MGFGNDPFMRGDTSLPATEEFGPSSGWEARDIRYAGAKSQVSQVTSTRAEARWDEAEEAPTFVRSAAAVEVELDWDEHDRPTRRYDYDAEPVLEPGFEPAEPPPSPSPIQSLASPAFAAPAPADILSGGRPSPFPSSPDEYFVRTRPRRSARELMATPAFEQVHRSRAAEARLDAEAIGVRKRPHLWVLALGLLTIATAIGLFVTS